MLLRRSISTVFVNASLGNLFLAGNITASSTGQGNISASGHLVVDEILIPTFKLITPVDKAASGAPLIKTTGDIDNTNAIISLGDPKAVVVIDPVIVVFRP